MSGFEATGGGTLCCKLSVSGSPSYDASARVDMHDGFKVPRLPRGYAEAKGQITVANDRKA